MLTREIDARRGVRVGRQQPAALIRPPIGFEAKATDRALREWCALDEIEIVG
ncbi:hypothetical protein FHR88_003838 [Bradyrhizobium betae]|nr:hypothetical protein [Bradyrhizobium betae]